MSDAGPPPSATVLGGGVTLGVVGLAAGTAWLLGQGRPGYAAAVGFAAGVCLAAAGAGWAVARCSGRTPAARVGAVLGVILVRTLPPLVALGWLQAGGRPLRDAGAAGLLVVFYLAVLASDVILTIIGRRESRRAACENAPN